MKSLKYNPQDERKSWVYKMKTGADGSVERYKARLVDETFCPVARQECLRTVLALSAQYGLKLHQVDDGNLEEEAYMDQPEGSVSKGQEQLVCKLKKSIYGLKQSPQRLNAPALDAHLKKLTWLHTIK